MNNRQGDPRWGNILLGFSKTATIGTYGCVITCLSDILNTTPDIVNTRLKAVNGFDGSLVIWSKIAQAFPGVSAWRVYSYNNTDVLKMVPNVLVESSGKPIGGSGSHWTNYIGNKQLKDPWTGKIRPTSDFPNPYGYASISGKWNQTIGDDIRENKIRAVLNEPGTPQTRIPKIRAILSE